MTYPQNTYLFDGQEYLNTWIRDDDVDKYVPITQVYGVVFNENREILVCRQTGKHNWHLPGGHIKEGETYVEALQRELLEEADVEVVGIRPIGVQQVTIPDNLNFEPVYQLRCIATVDTLLPQTIDPDSKTQWERTFVLATDIKKFIRWGISGDAMLDDAVENMKNSKLFATS